jgi:hypothetical protein
MMRCKVGDLAMIVTSYAGNEGRVVTCLEYMGDAPDLRDGDYKILGLLKGPHWWRVDHNVNMSVRYGDGKVEIIDDCAPFCRDDFLMPIGNKDAPLEVVEDEKLPSAVPV